MMRVILVGRYAAADLVPWFMATPMEMPVLVPDRALKCVLFIGVKGKDGKSKFKPRATGFMVRIEDHQHTWYYVVTAQHVISGLLTKGHDVWLRINTNSGVPAELKTNPAEWAYHPDPIDSKTDVAVCPISFDRKDAIGAFEPVPIVGKNSVAMTRAEIQRTRTGIGEEVVVTGLFRSHHGQERNIPITRIGNIAMLDTEPVKTEYCGYIDAYLIEARSIGGLSGSPCFVHFPAIRTIDGKTGAHPDIKIVQLYLLGLVHGHFDIEDLNSDVVLDDERDASSGIHAGIGVVVPVEKIIETVMQPELSMARKKIVDEDRRKSGAVADIATDAEDASPASDVNPNHRGDFTSLLNAAVKTREPKD